MEVSANRTLAPLPKPDTRLPELHSWRGSSLQRGTLALHPREWLGKFSFPLELILDHLCDEFGMCSLQIGVYA